MRRLLLVCATCLFIVAGNYGVNGSAQEALHSRSSLPHISPVSTTSRLLFEGFVNPRGVISSVPSVASNFQLVFVLADGYQSDGAGGIYLVEPQRVGVRGKAPELVVSLADLGGAHPTSAAIDPNNCRYFGEGILCILFVTTDKGGLYQEQLMLR
jgi:hypothetical protein